MILWPAFSHVWISTWQLLGVWSADNNKKKNRRVNPLPWRRERNRDAPMASEAASNRKYYWVWEPCLGATCVLTFPSDAAVSFQDAVLCVTANDQTRRNGRRGGCRIFLTRALQDQSRLLYLTTANNLLVSRHVISAGLEGAEWDCALLHPPSKCKGGPPFVLFPRIWPLSLCCMPALSYQEAHNPSSFREL